MWDGSYQIKRDTIQPDFAALLINLSQFKSQNFFKVLYYDYSKFCTKIMICFQGDIRIQIKKFKK